MGYIVAAYMALSNTYLLNIANYVGIAPAGDLDEQIGNNSVIKDDWSSV